MHRHIICGYFWGIFISKIMTCICTDNTTRLASNGERPTILQKRIILHLSEVLAHPDSFRAVVYHDIGSDKSVGVSGGWLQVRWPRSVAILAFSLGSSRVAATAFSLIRWAWELIVWFVLPFRRCITLLTRLVASIQSHTGWTI